MRITIAVAAFCLLSIAVPCAAQTFILEGASHCPSIGQGRYFSLFTGTYHIKWVSGAYSTFPNDFEQGGYTWVGRVRVYIYSTAEELTIGAPPSPGFYATEALAEAAALGTYPIVVASNSVVSFYLFDIGDCVGNRGTITLMFVSPLPTETSTWGAIKALYR